MNQKNVVLAAAMLVVGVAVGYAVKSKGDQTSTPVTPAAQAPAADMSGMPPHGADEARVPVDIAAMEARLKQNPRDIEALLSIADEHVAQGAVDKAIPYLEKAKESATTVDDLLNVARVAKVAGQSGMAMVACEDAIKKDARAAEAYHIAGTLAWHDLQDNDKAIRYWTKYLELDPNAPNGEMIKRTIEALKSGSVPAGAMSGAMGGQMPPAGGQGMPAGHPPMGEAPAGH